jgi:hypothetical protein
MRRSRYGGYGRTPRAGKIRSPISVKAKIAKRGGKCNGCRGRFEIGDNVTYVKIKRRVYHTASCVPANAGSMPAAGAGPVITDAASVAKAFSTQWTVGEAQMIGLLALENALTVAIKRGVVKMDKATEDAFDKYEKFKSMALRPGSAQEGKQALVLAIRDLVKLVFNN